MLPRGPSPASMSGERLRERGIIVRAQNRRALAEESSEAYKDVREVVSVLQRAGIAGIVAELQPLGVVKG